MQLTVNGVIYDIDEDGRMPLLRVLRDSLGLVGTKYGCGIGVCGACNVLIDDSPVRSCQLRLEDAVGEIITIEGADQHADMPVVQRAWVERQVAQCGYCQPGQIITAVALLNSNPSPTDEDIKLAFAGNLCRCGTYNRIREAVKAAAVSLSVTEAT